MYISKNSLAYPYEYTVHIDYLDAAISDRNDDSKLDDIQVEPPLSILIKEVQLIMDKSLYFLS